METTFKENRNSRFKQQEKIDKLHWIFEFKYD